MDQWTQNKLKDLNLEQLIQTFEGKITIHCIIYLLEKIIVL